MALFYSTTSFIKNLFTTIGAPTALNEINTKDIKYYNLLKKPDLKKIENYKLVIVDMDGVIRNGYKKIGLANIVLEKFNDKNIPFLIITNECRKDPKTIRHDLEMMDFKINKNTHIVSASLLVKNTLINLINEKEISLKNNIKTKNNNICFNIGVVSNIDNFNYFKTRIKKKCNVNINFYFIEEKCVPMNLDYIVIGCLDNNKKIDENLFRTLQWIDNNPNAELIISCPDIDDVENQETITHYLPINILKEVENRVQNKHTSINFNLVNNDIDKNISKRFVNYKIDNKQIIIGKPYIESMRDILNYFNVDIPENLSSPITNKNKILVVGDNLNTDIKLAKKLKCDSALVMSGVTKYQDLIKLIESGEEGSYFVNTINYIIPDISYLIM
jgi:ribonucleotide monophosphatase NagD (HAD superfamily)